MAPKRKSVALGSSSRVKQPSFGPEDDVDTFDAQYANRNIIIEKGFTPDILSLGVEAIFQRMGWTSLLHLKEPLYPRLMKLFCANLKFSTLDNPTLYSHIQGIPLEFNSELLGTILQIPSPQPYVFEQRKASEFDGFNMLDSVRELTNNPSLDTPAISSTDFSFMPRLLHKIISQNLLPRIGHKTEVTYMDVLLIHSMMKGHSICLPYMMIRTIINAHQSKQQALPYAQIFTRIFKYFSVRLIPADRIQNKTTHVFNIALLTKMGFHQDDEGNWIVHEQASPPHHHAPSPPHDAQQGTSGSGDDLSDLRADVATLRSALDALSHNTEEELRNLREDIHDLGSYTQDEFHALRDDLNHIGHNQAAHTHQLLEAIGILRNEMRDYANRFSRPPRR